MNANQISEGLADVGSDFAWQHHYAVQGVYQGRWRTLFAPYLSIEPAKAMQAKLEEANPACQYQTIKVERV